MAWNEVANLTGPAGPQGPQGAKGDQGAQGPQGPAGTSAPKYYGVLRWGTLGWYNPPNDSFHRLAVLSGAKLTVHKSVGGVASVSGDFARLYIPVAGMWLLSATQTWGNSTANKGMGLTRSTTSATTGVELWTDNNLYNHVTVSRLTYLDAGVFLYPWTWNGVNTGMSFADRGYTSEYSATLVQPM